jgi:hypothetical protein
MITQAVKSSLPWLAPLGFLALFYFYPLASILQTSFARGDAGLTAPARLAAPFIEAFSSASARCCGSPVAGSALNFIDLIFGSAFF